MLYPKSKEAFSKELFKNPTSEYRAAPFWAWNCHMTKENIDRSIKAIKDMGMGGGHIHSRTGLDNVYLGNEFMDMVHYTNEAFQSFEMQTYLYDEDRWPSGAAGGYVTQEHNYRIRFLVFSPDPPEKEKNSDFKLTSSGQAVRSMERTFLARYAVRLEQKYLASYRLLKEEDSLKEGEKEWFAWLEVSGDNPWFNNQAYLNTLDKNAVEQFIKVTHEKYYSKFKDQFGKSIPSIFTDEPQFARKNQLKFAEDRTEIILPFTDDLEETFTKKYNESLLDHLPELFWELPGGKISTVRYEYHDHIAERFAAAFADTVGAWCQEHHIKLTGHMMEEPTLMSQTAALGEAMRSYRSFDIPGIDMLCDWRELSTAKQAQSACHQFDREGVSSELYGVTNWDFDFKGHKLAGDWQAALGVTLRIPHLMWTSMEGEAKRDYPAAIGFQSPWYKEYPYIENYFSRLNTILTRGSAEVKIGVIHPVESYWLYWGTEEQTGSIRKEMDQQFSDLINYFLFGLLDFDFISESLLPQLNNKKNMEDDNRLRVGKMAYDVIVIPNCHTLRSTTVDILEHFSKCGGKVIFTGVTPYLENAAPSERIKKLMEKSDYMRFSREAFLEALAPYRLIDIRDSSGNRASNLIYQLREEEEKKWLFIAHVHKMENPDVPNRENVIIYIKGTWSVTEYNALDAAITTLPCRYQEGMTVIDKTFYEQDSLLIGLELFGNSEKGKSEIDKNVAVKEEKDNFTNSETRLTQEKFVPVTLEEPNVCVLDMAEYCFDDGKWNPEEEVLRIDNLFRKKLGYPLRMEAYAQPWTVPAEERNETAHTLKLRFRIKSEVSVNDVELGMENADKAIIRINGAAAEQAEGYYVDPCVQKRRLGRLECGDNELEVEIPYSRTTNVEAMYLLGRFGVRVEGASTTITEPVCELAFDSIVAQGLPFYGGNFTYHVETNLQKEEEIVLSVSKYRAPLLQVGVDGNNKGYIAFSPYCLNLGRLSEGSHMIDIKVFGNRINTFGSFHNCDENTEWYGPESWRTTGKSWAYEYQLKRMGILKAPTVKI